MLAAKILGPNAKTFGKYFVDKDSDRIDVDFV